MKETLFLLALYPYRESDLIGHFLTSARGIVKAVLYRGKRAGTGNSFSYNPGELLQMEFREKPGQEFVSCSEIAPLKRFDQQKISYPLFVSHTFLVEVLHKLARHHEPSPFFFTLLRQNLDLLPSPGEKYFHFILWAVGKLLLFNGIYPDYRQCRSCRRPSWKKREDNGQPVFRQERYRLDLRQGTLVCSECEYTGEQDEEAVTSAMIKLMWLIESLNEFEEMPAVIPPQPLLRLTALMSKFLAEQTAVHPKSLPLFLTLLQRKLEEEKTV